MRDHGVDMARLFEGELIPIPGMPPSTPPDPRSTTPASLALQGPNPHGTSPSFLFDQIDINILKAAFVLSIVT